MQTASNPYQSPSVNSPPQLEPSSSSGVAWLLGGVGVLVVCGFILGYLAVAEVPHIRKLCVERNINVPWAILMGERVVIFVCEQWLILLIAAIGPFVLIDRYCSVKNKRKVRKCSGVLIAFVSILFTLWIGWATLSAT